MGYVLNVDLDEREIRLTIHPDELCIVHGSRGVSIQSAEVDTNASRPFNNVRIGHDVSIPAQNHTRPAALFARQGADPSPFRVFLERVTRRVHLNYGLAHLLG